MISLARASLQLGITASHYLLKKYITNIKLFHAVYEIGWINQLIYLEKNKSFCLSVHGYDMQTICAVIHLVNTKTHTHKEKSKYTSAPELAGSIYTNTDLLLGLGDILYVG